MKNLILLSEKRKYFPIKFHESDTCTQTSYEGSRQFISDICYNPNEYHDDIEPKLTTYLLYNSGEVIAHINSHDGNNGSLLWTANLSTYKDENENGSDNVDFVRSWFSITFVSELNALVCISHNGEIVNVDPENGECVSVGSFANGISDGKWSPDEEILALYTYNDNGSSVLITMNLEFEVLNEVPVPQPLQNENNEMIPPVQVSWRPDATKIAVSSTDHDDAQCKIRFFDRDTLEMEYIAREEDGSGKLVRNIMQKTGLAWSGDYMSFIIASVQQQRKKKMPMVVFMEPNGLRHREFQLRADPGETPEDVNVCNLHWNVESDILSVILDGKDANRVQFWHRCNYHWYMKYELRYPNHKVQKVLFDLENPYCVSVVLRNSNIPQIPIKSEQYADELRVYEFCWDCSTIAIGCPLSTVSVIDGRNLNLTPLAKAIVPPPMYAVSLQIDLPVNQVAHMPHGLSIVKNTNVSIASVAQLSNGDLVVLCYDKNLERHQNDTFLIANYSPPSILATFTDFPTIDDASCLRQITILNYDSDRNTLTLIAVSCLHSIHEQIIEIELDLTALVCTIQNTVTLEGRVLRVNNWADRTVGAIIELNDGTSLSYDSRTGITPLSCEPLMEPCPWVSAINVASELELNPVPHIIGISKRSRLYCNDILINSAASSFVLNSSPHGILSYTTLGSISQIRTIPLKALIRYDPLAGMDNDVNAIIQGEGYEPRMVERGSVLVSICNSSPTAILQLPRGNLEAVYPRSLVIPHVMNLIFHKDYAKAVNIMRKQKIDLNLIVDWDPKRFVTSDVEKFVTGLDREDFLNLFIANLRNDDVTLYKYPIPSWSDAERSFWSDVQDEVGALNNKVNIICQTLRRTMLEQNDTDGSKFHLPVLSTFAKEEPPRLEEALKLVQDNAVLCDKNSRDKIQSSIQYLAFLADYETLYNTALGMYEFGLAKAVARNSQLDPKVYVPQIKRWKEMVPKDLAKYEVDLKLLRYESALQHLYNAGQYYSENEVNEQSYFDKCFDLIEEHNLHALGLKLFCEGERRRRVMNSLGERLLNEKDGHAAVSIFLATVPPNLEAARRAAKMCGDWKTFFTCLGPLESQNNLSSIATNIAEEISCNGSMNNKRANMKNAATILLDYAHDVEGAIEKLMYGEAWSEARRIALLHGKQHFEQRIVQSALAYCETCITDLEERAESFEKSNQRYDVVLKIRCDAKKKMMEEFGGVHEAYETGSTYSLSSNLSNMSLNSNMSGNSVGSVTSVSSVISVGDSSTFSMTSYDDVNKHKSKFNKIGRGDKKRKKKKKSKGKSKKIRPGSEEELNSLVSALKSSCVDSEYMKVIEELILFLTQVQIVGPAKNLFVAYEGFKNRVNQSQNERLLQSEKRRIQLKKSAGKSGHGNGDEDLELDCEQDVNALCVEKLPKHLAKIFSYI